MSLCHRPVYPPDGDHLTFGNFESYFRHGLKVLLLWFPSTAVMRDCISCPLCVGGGSPSSLKRLAFFFVIWRRWLCVFIYSRLPAPVTPDRKLELLRSYPQSLFLSLVKALACHPIRLPS